MMRSGAAGLAIAAFIPLATQAQSPAHPENSTAKLAIANEAIVKCGIRTQINAYFDKLSNSIVSAAKKSEFGLNDAQWAAYSDIVRKDMDAKTSDYISVVATDYALHFSTGDMHAMIEFCLSPAGKRISEARAQMETESFAVRQTFLKGAATYAMQDALQKVKSEKPL
jgi:hypothetical protein